MRVKKHRLDYAAPQRASETLNAARRRGCLVALAIVGLLPLLIGVLWLRVFIFTDYRAHHRHVMIPLGFAATAIGLGMLSLPFLLWRRR